MQVGNGRSSRARIKQALHIRVSLLAAALTRAHSLSSFYSCGADALLPCVVVQELSSHAQDQDITYQGAAGRL